MDARWFVAASTARFKKSQDVAKRIGRQDVAGSSHPPIHTNGAIPSAAKGKWKPLVVMPVRLSTGLTRASGTRGLCG